ncbi:MAG: 23S rRNA (pseudouridine(1915)-N(3))-methyltransferase RlmH [Verrucomicrobia bacterium]|nr:23S rRNA (pseudouridine(1915)-N(3))-methyltransferase RlmH [Verrucomicrobiota bacterium]
MIKIKILTIGKSKENWLQEALAEYEKRLRPFCTFEWILAKNDVQLEEFSKKEGKFIALDPQGKSMTSEKFAAWLSKAAINYHSRLAFVIGGAEGLSPALKAQSSFLWSLSPLTFTHQITRLILLEQIYRAYEINRGSDYHK